MKEKRGRKRDEMMPEMKEEEEKKKIVEKRREERKIVQLYQCDRKFLNSNTKKIEGENKRKQEKRTILTWTCLSFVSVPVSVSISPRGMIFGIVSPIR